MPTASSATYEFGPFRLEVDERRLTKHGSAVPLRTKVFDTLCVLVEHSGRLLTKHELMQSIWPDTVVEENNLNHNISTLRRTLDEQVTGQQLHRNGAASRIPLRRGGEDPARTGTRRSSRRRPWRPDTACVRRFAFARRRTAFASPIQRSAAGRRS